jgi:hypothetical protein
LGQATFNDHVAARAARKSIAQGASEALAALRPEARMIAVDLEFFRTARAFRDAALAGGTGSQAYEARRAFVMTNHIAGRHGRLALKQGAKRQLYTSVDFGSRRCQILINCSSKTYPDSRPSFF